MDCCSTQGTEKFFSRWSKKYLKRFRRKGLAKEQQYLVEGILRDDVSSKTILEIGSGVGAVHMTLLERGAASAVGVDLAEGMIQQARQLARELGLDRRTRYIVGDFAAMDGEIPTSDITILDKVVCCYEDVDTLLEKSIGKTKGLYALSFPREIFPVRWLFKTQIFIARVFRFSFHPYWHDWESICLRIGSRGFGEVYRNTTIAWDVRVFRRNP